MAVTEGQEQAWYALEQTDMTPETVEEPQKKANEAIEEVQRQTVNLVIGSRSTEPLSSGVNQGSQDHQASQFYRPLDNDTNEIRVLKVSPGFGSDIISCTLVHISLNDCLPYRAISYTWGDSSDMQTILLNGKEFQIRRNAYDALAQLRSTSEFEVFWIDAICINQSDNSERSLEITKMRRIFSRATSVVIWLGPSDETTEKAFAFVRLFHQTDSKEAAIRLLKGPTAAEDLGAVVRMFDRNYWNRIWVVQEIASASKSDIYCGAEIVAWKTLFQIPEMFSAIQSTVREAFETQRDVDAYVKSETLAFSGPFRVSDRIFDSSKTEKPIQLLARVVRKYRHLKSTDPKDKIYGLIGLVADTGDIGLDLNYESAVHDVYSNFIKTVVSATLELDIICCSQPRTNTFDLPSWTPDWWSRRPRDGRYPYIVACRDPPWHSAKESKATCSFIKELGLTKILVARGFSIDRIRVAGPASPNFKRDLMRGVAGIFEEWRKLCSEEKGDSLEVYSTFFKTMFCGVEQESALHSPEVQFQCFLHTMRSLCSRTTIDEILLGMAESSKSQFKDDDAFTAAGVTVVFQMRKIIQGRRFFISSLGHMGMAPDSAEVGDELCILLGCSCPVILRPHNYGEYYTLIGEAYVDEYMTGRGMDELEDGKYVLKDFKIY